MIVFTGHFGSGKTELSINYALKALDSHDKVILVDLDIVNPFFRTAEVKEELEQMGIKVYTPNFANTSLDIPSLPPDIYSVFADKTAKVIFDVGGDEDGARALGVFYPHFQKEDYRMFYVVNTKRPLTGSVNAILEMKGLIEASSRLRVTDIINNTNLSYETQACDIIKGQLLVDKASKEANIPVTYISGTDNVIDELPEDIGPELFPLRLYMKPPWRQIR